MSTLQSRPMIKPKLLGAARPSTRKAPAPSSAPAAAGRSPKSKRRGILSRRRVSAIDPPSGLSSGLPFSIDAALSGTVSSYKTEPVQTITVPLLEESVPKNWMFNIHEDTDDDELNNVMSFTTQTLDISDDESRRAEKNDRGKENIPPSDIPSMFATPSVASTRPVSRNDMMTDEPRTPLGSLDAAEFYAEGCDASSNTIVPAEKSYDVNEKCYEPLAVEDPASITSPSKASGSQQSKDGWKDFLEQIEVAKKANAVAILPAVTTIEEPVADNEIWESESAKGDEDAGVQHTYESPLESGSAGSLEADVFGKGGEPDCEGLIF